MYLVELLINLLFILNGKLKVGFWKDWDGKLRICWNLIDN